jgi:hypothetical protein
VEEVTPEAAARDTFREVPGADGEEAHVGLPLAATERRVAALGEQAQQLGLRGEWQLFDRIEQQGAAFGGGHPPDVGGDGPGERAGGVPEELALEERGGDAGRIDLDQRPEGARAPRVQGARQRGASGPRLPEDEHRCRRGGGARQHGGERGERRGAREEAVERALGRPATAHAANSAVTSGLSAQSRSRA